MGEVDSDNLFKIYYEIGSIKKRHGLNYNFKIDHGTFETGIEFTAIGYHHPPISKSWKESKKEGNDIFCPDLLDYENKIIVEYEEEPTAGKKGGKMGKKGHTEESKKDSRRDSFYSIGGFRVFKVWESDKDWRTNLEQFLLNLETV